MSSNKSGKIIVPYIAHSQYEDLKVPDWCLIYSEEVYGIEMFFNLDEENQWWYADLSEIRDTYGKTDWKLIFNFDESSYELEEGSYQCYDSSGEATAKALLNVDINVGTIHAYLNNVYNADYIDIILTFKNLNDDTGGGGGTSTTYTISYDANGGYNAPSEQTVTEGEWVNLSYDTPTRDGYEFLGWSTRYDATSVEYCPGDSCYVDGDLYLYAVWEKNDDEPSSGDFTYSINSDDQTVTITGYEGDGGEIDIPSTLDGYNVTTIGEEAFANCSTLTAVTFPENVSVIETGAFYNCVNLSTCKFLNSGVTIEDVSWTFFGCENLTNIYLYRGSTAAVYFPYDEYTLHYLDDAVYYVYYDANGGNDAPSRQSFAEGEGIWLSDTEPTRAGYDFLGWSTDYEADSVEYYPGEYYELTGDLYLYAVWEAAEVKYNNTEFYFSEDVSDISSYSVTPPAGATQEYPLGGSTTIIDIGWYTIEATAEKDIVAWQILFDDKEYIIRSENSYESGSCKLNYESDGTLSIWLQGFTSPRITISALTEYNPSGGGSVPSSGKYRVLINGVPAKWKGSDGNYYYMYVEWKNN